MIRLKSVVKRIGTRNVLDCLDFEAADGRVTGILGPNGAGKTTALRALAGLVGIDAGHVEIDGVPVALDPLAARRRLGVLPEDPGLYPRLTAREHLAYTARLHGLRGNELERATDRAATLVDLGSLLDRRTSHFSRGERQKVALARALVHDPHNVVLDEPTNGLDVAANRALRASIRSLAAGGRCVLLTSHVMQDVAALCDEIVIIDQGRRIDGGLPSELQERRGSATLEEAFLEIIGHGEGLW